MLVWWKIAILRFTVKDYEDRLLLVCLYGVQTCDEINTKLKKKNETVESTVKVSFQNNS